MAELNLSEEAEQRIVWQHWKKRGAPNAEAWATPNGGKRTRKAAVDFKATGVVAGIPDLLFFMDGKLFGIEMKKRKGGIVSKAQKNMIKRLNEIGATAVVAKGADEALDYLEAWGVLQGERWGIAIYGIPAFAGHDKKIMKALAA